MRKTAPRPLTGVAVLTAALLGPAVGCHGTADGTTPVGSGVPAATAAPRAPAVAVVRPERRTVRHQIEQPGFNIEAFQETPVFARITGYVGTWDPAIDIGRAVHKGQVLAKLSVPEMEVELKQKDAAVRQAAAEVGQAKAAALTATAQLARARSQYERLKRVGRGGLLDQENVEEVRLGYEAAKAGLEKANADVTAAEARKEVAEANRDYAQTMLEYARIRAPFDGVVTQRNVNVGDFVLPAGTGAKGQPLFVVSQMDPVRVFVNVPGADAAWIKDGDKVSLRLQGAGGELFEGKVTRNARSLDPRARTLRTEIDLPNPSGKLLPGMYVQASITVRHAGVWALPAGSVRTEGDQTFCFVVENGKALRTPLQVGLRGDGLVEVLKKEQQVRTGPSRQKPRWADIRGDEEVAADPAQLRDGEPVRRAPAAP
jgi:RND family efflux transporter MFP subunit